MLNRLWRHGFRRADFVPGAEFGVGALEHGVGFFWELDFPAFGENAEDAEGAAGAEPAFGDLFEMLDAVDNIALCVLFGQVEEVDSAG